MNEIAGTNMAEILVWTSVQKGRARVRRTLESILDLLESQIASYHMRTVSEAVRAMNGVLSFQFFISLPKVCEGSVLDISEQKFNVKASLFSVTSSPIECEAKLNSNAIIGQLRRDARIFVYKLEELVFQKLKPNLNPTGDDYLNVFSTLIVVDFFIHYNDGDMTTYWSNGLDHPGFPAVFRSPEENRLLYPKDWTVPRIED